MGRTLPAPAASAQAPSTGQLFAHHCGVAPPALAQRGTLGHRAIYLALWPPFSALCRLTSGKAALYTPTASCLHSPPCAVVGPQPPRRVRSRLSAPFLPLSSGRSGHRSGSTTLPPTCPAGLVSLEAPGRWLGPSCPRPPSFYLCWCLQFGVGSLGRQLRPVLAERCCLSLCGWTRLSLAPPRTL